MSFLHSCGKSSSNVTRQEQFLVYFRDTGAATALQKAMILLYRMPIKPTNLHEYFAEYLEDGARKLTILSSLKAELCYKHSETQDISKRIQYLQSLIQCYEPQQQAKPDEQTRYSVLEDEDIKGTKINLLHRYLDNLKNDNVARGSRASSVLSMDNEETIDRALRNFSYDIDAGEGEEFEETPGVKCVEEQDSATALRMDAKNLDPWGIICSFHSTKAETMKSEAAIAEKRRTINALKHKKKLKRTSVTSDLENSVDMSRSTGNSSRNSQEDERAYQNYDSEDAETLAEIYHTYAFDAIKNAQESLDRNEIQLPTTFDKKMLSVAQPPKTSMGNLLGWSPVHSRVNLYQPKQQRKSEDQPPSQVVRDRPKHWSEFVDKGDEEIFDPCYNDDYRYSFWMDFENNGNYAKSHPDDSFLLEKDMDRIAQKFDGLDNDTGFIYDFYKRFDSAGGEPTREQMEKACGGCKDFNKKPTYMDEGTMTIDPDTTCICGEDEDGCTCVWTTDDQGYRSVVRLGPKYGKSTPRKMINWTKGKDYLLTSLSGEDYDLLAEDDNAKAFRRKKSDFDYDEIVKSPSEEIEYQRLMEDISKMAPEERKQRLEEEKQKYMIKEQQRQSERQMRLIEERRKSLKGGKGRSRHSKGKFGRQKHTLKDREQRQLDDFDFSLSKTSSSSSNCACSDMSIPLSIDCSRFCQRLGDVLTEDSGGGLKGRRSSKNEATMTISEKQRQLEFSKLRRASGDPEIAKVFRESGGYATQDVKKWAEQAIRKSSDKGRRSGADGGKKYVSDAFELDLDKEVKKNLGV